MIELIKYLLPVIGVVIGALLQFLLSKKNETKKQQDLLKISAYTDLIKGLAGMAISRKYKDSIKEMEFKILVADAKSRICVYGDDTVIEKISYYLKMGGTLNSIDSEKAFVDIIVEIRKNHIGSIDLNINDFSQLLIGADIEINKAS
jgi:hypothetical protein